MSRAWRRMRVTLPVGAIARLSVAALLLTACGSGRPSAAPDTTTQSPAPRLAALQTPPSDSVTLSETGSTLLYPLFAAWASAYHKAHPSITVTTAGTGSSSGISQASAGTVNIGTSDAYLSPEDVRDHPGLENVPLAISAQMVNYNLPGLTRALKLSGPVLSGIYQGAITNWNDARIAAINSGVTLPDRTIVPLHRSEGSGDTFLFTQYLSRADPNGWGKKIGYGTTVAFPAVPGGLAEVGNSGMVSGCAATPGCIAYIGVSFQDQARSGGLGEAELQNGSGNYEALDADTVGAEAASYPITPVNGAISLIYATSAPNGYPIVNYEYAIVDTKQPNSTTARAIQALLAWALDPNLGAAGGYLAPVHFRPLPDGAIGVAANLLRNIH